MIIEIEIEDLDNKNKEIEKKIVLYKDQYYI